MLSGDSLFSEEALAHQGTPVKILQLAEKTGEKVKSGDDEKQVGENPEKEIFRTLERMLNGRGMFTNPFQPVRRSFGSDRKITTNILFILAAAVRNIV